MSYTFKLINKNTNDRKFKMLIYPEDRLDDNYSMYEYIKSYFETNDKTWRWGIMLHDKDRYTEEEVAAEITKNGKSIHEVGELKKAHYHVLCRMKDSSAPSWRYKKILENFKIPARLIAEVDDFNHDCLYLTHCEYDQEKKVSYDIENLEGNLKDYIIDLMKKKGQKVDEEEEALLIFEFIENCEEQLKINDLVKWALKNHHWATYRRGASIWNNVLIEHNKEIIAADYKKAYQELMEKNAILSDEEHEKTLNENLEKEAIIPENIW